MTAVPRAVAPTSPPGASRYQLERKLGEGASGAVHLAKDLETGELVAHKQLLRVDAKSVLRLKREFRALQAVNHPHIVKLYDMGQLGEAWFLTMEYLDGRDLHAYLSAGPVAVNDTQSTRGFDANTCSPHLISAFHQLAQGIAALHEFGMLHRDLKPSNVIVAGERVVVLDFGLVRELHGASATVTEAGAVAGTPAYMAPEQLLGQELSPASDWYAFGVMLYEAMSGVLPIEGPLVQLLRAKLERDPTPLARLTPWAPTWLTDLCMGLLCRDAKQRPTGKEILALFAAADPAAGVPRTANETFAATDMDERAGEQLFGRALELDLLQRALEECERRGSLAVHVRAMSGVGKSALLDHFLDRIAPALVLRSRCYELEAMPFKALDGLIDALLRHLSHLSDIEIAHVLPPDAPTLATVFPVLERLQVMRTLMRIAVTYDVLETRKRAEVALRSLLDNLAVRAPVVVWIDDLQWGDLDSARILKAWLAKPSSWPVLFVFSYRSDEVATSSCLRKLLGDGTEAGAERIDHAIDLAPLTHDQIRAMCEQRMRARMPERAEVIECVVRESQGSPFLASQLIALAEAKHVHGETDLRELSLDAMVAQIGALLADDAKVLLAVLAVAGRPIPPRLALEAAGIKHGGRAHLHDLRSLNLVRTREVSGVRTLEVYHDRIRERLEGTLTQDESTQLHGRLFDVIVMSEHADPDWLHRLALGAGDHAEALRYGKIAAERASAALAFERAAMLYKTCSESAPEAERGELLGQLSTARARAGRGVDAAKAALAAAEHADADAKVVWLHRAAQHYLRCGHFEQGEALVQKVLDAKRIRVPKSEFGLMMAIAWERLRIKFLGRSTVRSGGTAPAELLERFDLLMALAASTYLHDPLRSLWFQDCAMRCALKAGEPSRLVHALCSSAMIASNGSLSRAARDSAARLAQAQALNDSQELHEERAISAARAIVAFNLGQPREARRLSAAAEQLFQTDAQDDPIGNYVQRLLVVGVRLSAQHYFGEYPSFLAELHTFLRDAAASGNRLTALQLTHPHTLAEQILGTGSRARLDQQRSELPPGRFGTLHALHLSAVLANACWTHDYARAGPYLAEAWPKFERSAVRRARMLSVAVRGARARFLLNQHVLERTSKTLSTAIRADLKILEALAMPGSKVLALRTRARIMLVNGRPEQAAEHLRESISLREQLGTPHELARDQFALGAILGGDEGKTLCAAARAQIAALGVTDVEADLRAHYPELMERS